MKIANKIVESAKDQSSSLAPDGYVIIEAINLAPIIAAKLEPVREALRIAWNDGVCRPVHACDKGEPRCQCPDCKAVSDALAMFEEE